MVSSNASLSATEIAEATSPNQTLFFQLYKHLDDSIAERRVRDMERLGYKAIFLTVDAVVPSNRERDIRSPWEVEELETGVPKVHVDGVDISEENAFGTAGTLIVNDDRDMTWERVINLMTILKYT